MAPNRIELKRETLYEEIWAEPMTVVALRYNMSDVGLGKNCKKMNIPKPGLGYWAKIQAGRKLPRIPLPPLSRGIQESIWVIRLNAEEQERRQSLNKDSALEKYPVEKIEPESVLTDPHSLIKDASEAFSKKSAKLDERGAIVAAKKVLAIAVSPTCIERALLIMDVLVKAMINYGISIEAGDSGNVTVDGEKIDLTLNERFTHTEHIETAEDIAAKARYSKASGHGRYIPYPNIPRYDYQPTGVLTIKLGNCVFHGHSATQSTHIRPPIPLAFGH